ncbi:MAG TPA: DUF2147 domain-containing protein [Steroidobacteraceae bacterium]|nr:DUF2147 domain-containing protein [Steroidobacteraceae bacterium]
MPLARGADLDSPVGRWQLIDDETHSPRGIVEISLVAGELQGRFVKAFLRPGEPAGARCVKCAGERHDQPMVGMVILWGLRPRGNEWVDGHILDPTQGRIYGATVALLAGGTQLKVHGYLGISLLGRSQVWQRLP